MDPDLQESVPPVQPWELTTRKVESGFEPAVTMAPWVQVFEGSALQRSNTLASSGSTSSSEVLSSSVSLAESAQSIPLDAEMGEISREDDASLRAPKSEPKPAEDGGVFSGLNTASSPADEKGEWLKSERVDQMRENVDLDASLLQEQSLDESRSSTLDSISNGGLNSEETSMSQLDDLLQLDAREFVGDEGTAFVDSLFPGSLGQDFFSPESVGDWAIDCFPEFPSLHASQQSPEVHNHESADQDASHKWFQNYLHRFSLSDLRKIKLKKSTIEIATRRLGGGKKGMLCFLKLVLVWLLNQNAKRMHSDSSGSGKLPTGDLDKYFANEHVAGFSASVEDKSANCLNRIPASQVLQEGSSTQEQVLSPHPALRRNEEDMGVAFAGSSSQCTRLSNPVVGMRNMHGGLSGVGSVRSLYTPSFPHSTDPNENNWSSLQPFNNTKYKWSPRDGDGGATTSPDASDFSGSPFPAMLPQGMNGESEWHGYCGSTLHETNLQPSPGTGAVSSSFGTYNPSSSDSMGLTPNTSAATTRAARMSRMERRKWSVRRQQRWTSKLPPGNLQWPYPISRASPANSLPYSPRSGQRLARSSVETQQVKKSERNLRLLFQKELKQSDVGNLGRIVLPKKAAETSLPPIDLRDGVNLVVEDLNSSKVWNMRYRFWPNNKSRMYLLENTGDFVKSYNLKEGDYMILYINISNNKYMIRGDKGKPANAAAVSENAYSDLSTSNGYGVVKNYRSESGLTNLVGSYPMDQPNRHQVPKAASPGITITSEETCGGSEVELDDFFIAELEQSLEDIDDT